MSSAISSGAVVVQGVRPGDTDGVDVRQRGEHVHAVEPHEGVAISGDHQRRNGQAWEPLQRRVPRHRLEQRQAAQQPEAQVVASGDRDQRERLAEPVDEHLSNRPGKWAVVRSPGR